MQRAEVAARYEAGENLLELGRRFNLYYLTISKILDRQGVRRRWRILSETDIELAISLYEEGQSLVQVGERFKVNAETIRLQMKKRGVAPRRRPEVRP